MLLKRAHSIIKSKSNFEVIYNGNPIWIEGLNAERGTANIEVLGKGDKMEVPLSDLHEI